MPIQPIYLNNGPNWPNWWPCLAGSSKTAPRILIFSIVLGAECSFYVKSIATYAPQFLGYNNSFLAIVRALELVTLSLKIPNQAAEWEHYKLWHYNGFKVIVQLHSIYQNCRQFPFVKLHTIN